MEAEKLFNEIKPFLLSISGKKFGINEGGGVLLMSKIFCIQSYWDQALYFYQICNPTGMEGFVFTEEQKIEWINKLKTVVYFINRKVEYFDDFNEQELVVEIADGSEKPFDINKIKEMNAHDFSYLKNIGS